MNPFTSKPNQKTPPVKAAINILLLCCIAIGLFWFLLFRTGIFLDFSFFIDLRHRIWDGFLMTIFLSIASLFLSLLIGILSAIMQNSKILILRYLSSFYVKIIRGTPLIMQIYLFFYIVGTALGVEDRFIAGVIILSIFEGAYISEIIRGSLSSLETSQLDAAKAVGFTKLQTVFNIILPQMTARTLPALTGQFASIIKDSSLLSIISIIELSQTMREISSIDLRLFESYFLLGILYLCLTLPVSFISKRLERRFSYED